MLNSKGTSCDLKYANWLDKRERLPRRIEKKLNNLNFLAFLGVYVAGGFFFFFFFFLTRRSRERLPLMPQRQTAKICCGVFRWRQKRRTVNRALSMISDSVSISSPIKNAEMTVQWIALNLTSCVFLNGLLRVSREILLHVQRRIRVDVGHVFGVKRNPYLKIKYTFESFHQPAAKL